MYIFTFFETIKNCIQHSKNINLIVFNHKNVMQKFKNESNTPKTLNQQIKMEF